MSTGRVSSFEAARATRPTVSTSAATGTGTTTSPPASGRGGKSSERSVRMWKVALPARSSTSCSAARSSSDTSLAGSARTTSSRSRAGSTTSPACSIEAVSGTRRPISTSVARTSAPPSVTATWTPDSACTALRVDATRPTTCSWASSSSRSAVSFTEYLFESGWESGVVRAGSLSRTDRRARSLRRSGGVLLWRGTRQSVNRAGRRRRGCARRASGRRREHRGRPRSDPRYGAPR